jgi:LDH2 family malate/lactate/ureidoglycolate dehydrogenase
MRAERGRQGIPLDRNTWQQILEVARQAGCPADEVPAEVPAP